jgi:hypothetical protein
MDALEYDHYLIAAIVALAGVIVFLWHDNKKSQAKKDAVILRITEDYAKEVKEMAVDNSKVIAGVMTSLDNNTKVIERLLDRDENTSRRR